MRNELINNENVRFERRQDDIYGELSDLYVKVGDLNLEASTLTEELLEARAEVNESQSQLPTGESTSGLSKADIEKAISTLSYPKQFGSDSLTNREKSLIRAAFSLLPSTASPLLEAGDMLNKLRSVRPKTKAVIQDMEVLQAWFDELGGSTKD